jgi:SAM-dependent methyltransferase
VVARDGGGGPRYVRGRGERSPCRIAAFDAVVLCLALEHVDPFEPAIHETARVLEPGGRFVLFLAHPLLQAPGSGWVENDVLVEAYWRLGAYLGDDATVDEVAPGVNLVFMHRPLEQVRARDESNRCS